MTDFARLQFVIDSSEAVRARGDLDAMFKAAGRAEKGAERLKGEAAEAGAGLDRTAEGARRATGALARMRGALAPLMPFLTTVGAIAAGGSALRLAGQFKTLENSFIGMGQTAEEASRSLKTVAEIAQQTRAPLGATATLYNRISVAASELNASSAEVGDFTRTVAQAMASAAGGAAGAEGALLQLSQAMAGGVVRAEEFTSILDGAYPLALAAAKGIDEAGGSIGKLRQMVIAGEVSSREFFDAILSQSSEIEEAFNKTAITTGQATTNLITAITQLLGGFDKATGGTNILAMAISGLANVVNFLGQNIQATISVMSGLAAAYASLKVYGIAAGIGAWASSHGLLTGAIWKNIFSLRTLRAALRPAGIGVLVLLIGSAVAAFVELSQRVGGAGRAFSLLWDVVKDFGKRFIDIHLAMAFKAEEAFFRVRAAVAGAFAGMMAFVSPVVNKIIGAHQAIKVTAQGVWGSMGSLAAMAIEGAANLFIGGFGQMLNHVIDKVNSFTGEVFRLLSKVPGIDLTNFGTIPSIDLPEVRLDYDRGALGNIASDAQAAFNADYLGPITNQLNGFSAAYRGAADDAAASANDLIESITAPLDSIDALVDAWKGNQAISEEADDATSSVNGLGDGIDLALGSSGGGGAAKAIQDTAKNAEEAESAVDKLKDQLKAMFDGFKNGNFFGSIRKFWKDFTENGSLAISEIGKKIKGLAGDLKGAFQTVVGAIKEIGNASIGDATAKNFFGNIGGALNGDLSSIVNLAKGAIGGSAITGTGIQGTIGGSGAKVLNSTEKTTKRLWGLYERVRTTLKGNAGLSKSLGQRAKDMQSVVGDLAFSLGASTGDLSKVYHSFNFSTKGLSKGQIQQKLQAALSAYGDKLANQVTGLSQFVKSGESSFQALTRLSQSLSTVNGAFEALGFNLYQTSLAGADAASSMVDLFGGLDQFTSATNAYYNRFYSDGEKFQFSLSQMQEQLQDLGINTVPLNAQGFRALVDAAKAVGNDELVASLIQMAPAVGELIDQSNRLQDSLGGLAKSFETLADERYARALLANGGHAANDDLDPNALAQLNQTTLSEMSVDLKELLSVTRTDVAINERAAI